MGRLTHHPRRNPLLALVLDRAVAPPPDLEWPAQTFVSLMVGMLCNPAERLAGACPLPPGEWIAVGSELRRVSCTVAVGVKPPAAARDRARPVVLRFDDSAIPLVVVR